MCYLAPPEEVSKGKGRALLYVLYPWQSKWFSWNNLLHNQSTILAISTQAWTHRDAQSRPLLYSELPS